MLWEEVSKEKRENRNMKTAVVTGGTKGIGLAIVEKLLENGYRVIATFAGDVGNAESVRRRLENIYQDRAVIVHQLMEKEPDVSSLNAKLERYTKDGIDVLVLNAGCTDRTAWKDLTWEQWMHVMDVNINAPAALVRALDKDINENGSIIFISSDMSVYPHATSVPYTVSKAAVNGLTLALVKEYADRKIRVNAVLPGFVETPWQKEKPAAQRQRICDKVALNRFAEPQEIADVVLSIVNSTYINGSLIKVDGGYCYR